MATRNYVPRANGEGSIGTEKKHWGGGFFDKLAVKTLEVIGGGTENDAQPATVGWVKQGFGKLLKSALEAAGVRYSMAENGYLCLGALFGNIKIQWGATIGSQEGVKDKSIQVTPLIAISTEYFSCGNVNIAGGTADGNWNSVKPIVSTIFGDGKLNVSSTYFEPTWRYVIRWLLIGV